MKKTRASAKPTEFCKKLTAYEVVKKGMFGIRGATDIVAREREVSRYTIHNYIREYKSSLKTERP